jgi:signal transduction histidine kinase
MNQNAETAPQAETDKQWPRGRSLSAKLLVLTALFVMVSEVLIYVPSIANFRNTWLMERLSIARVAAIALTNGVGHDNELQIDLLKATGVYAIAVPGPDRRQLFSADATPLEVERHVDMRAMTAWRSIVEAFDTLVRGGRRSLRVIGAARTPGGRIEMVLDEAPLRDAMLLYSRNIMGLSLIISLITATLVYFSLRWLLVRPLQRLTRSMARFSADPEDSSRIIEVSARADELGLAEAELAHMQQQLSHTLQHQRRLASLGLAVSKINHDLRNMLASAQLVTDRLGHLPDPTVQRLSPKLVNALDRAISYTRSVLAYGGAQEPPPDRRLLNLAGIIDDVGDMLDLPDHETIRWSNEVQPGFEIDADPDQLFRVLSNLCRNALQALDGKSDHALINRLTVSAWRDGDMVTIRVADTGPGIPPRAREHLFQAFQGSVRAGGTGLGLAIAAELVHAHGGTIELAQDGPGAIFDIKLPGRPIDLEEARRASTGTAAQ